MNIPDNLMSFLTLASSHIPVNQERLEETAQEERMQEAAEAALAESEETQTQQAVEEPNAETAEEPAVQYNIDLLAHAMANLGINTVVQANDISVLTTYTPASQETLAFTETVDTLQDAPEVQQPEPEPEPEEQEDVPENERPVTIHQNTPVRQELIRFSDAEWFNKVQEKTIILAGVGGIGSNMAVILAKLNPAAIYIFDDDTVELANLAGQFYSNEDVGKPKVDALAASITKYTNYSSIIALNRKFLPGEGIVTDIMVCGFDNMRARKHFFGAWKERVKSLPAERAKDCLFIDGRLSADELQIFCMTGEDDFYMEDYANNYLFDDYEAQREVCSFKQTGFLAEMIGALMVNLIVNFCANQVNPRRNMTLPFRTSYRSSIMFLDLKR